MAKKINPLKRMVLLPFLPIIFCFGFIMYIYGQNRYDRGEKNES